MLDPLDWLVIQVWIQAGEEPATVRLNWDYARYTILKLMANGCDPYDLINRDMTDEQQATILAVARNLSKSKRMTPRCT